jgi:hypothetical protein
MLLELNELFPCAFFTRQVSKFEKDYQMIVKLTIFDNLLHQLDEKHTLACSTLAKQHKVSFFIGLFAIPEHPLNLVQKLEVIRIVIFSAAFLLDITLKSKQLRHGTILACCFLLFGFGNP